MLISLQAEEEERIRWATPLGRVHGGQRTRANRIMRRLDSCVTEASSEANTPDPLSPGQFPCILGLLVVYDVHNCTLHLIAIILL